MEELAERIEEASGATAAQMELNKKRESEVGNNIFLKKLNCISLGLYFETAFLQGCEDEEGSGGDQHPAGGNCAQPQEETPGGAGS